MNDRDDFLFLPIYRIEKIILKKYLIKKNQVRLMYYFLKWIFSYRGCEKIVTEKLYPSARKTNNIQISPIFAL